jgi:hypothetical protein
MQILIPKNATPVTSTILLRWAEKINSVPTEWKFLVTLLLLNVVNQVQHPPEVFSRHPLQVIVLQ